MSNWNKIFKPIVVLCAICVVITGALAATNAATAPVIAKAKAEGVSFGRRRNPLPDNFEEARLLWRNHELKLKDAAKHCGMAETSFYDAVRRMEEPVKVNSRKPLPENFEEARLLWRSHKLKMKDAAERCGMAPSTFYGAVQRVESANND